MRLPRTDNNLNDLLEGGDGGSGSCMSNGEDGL
jgi:hypothetical protein